LRKSKVAIVNPVAGGGSITSRNRARRFISRGVAEYTSPAEDEIRFLQTPKQQALVQSAEERLHARVTGCTIDHLQGTFFECARALPLINAHLMMRGKPAKKREGSAG